jgi:hypothetical protein
MPTTGQSNVDLPINSLRRPGNGGERSASPGALTLKSKTPSRYRMRYDLKLWIGSGGGSAAYLPG